MNKLSLYGLVLIGGKSVRMGRDKSLLHYHDKNQREHLYQLLSKFCEKVYLSCNQEQSPDIVLPSITDNRCEGPITGLLSAYHKHPAVSWLVLACDMPLINEKTIQQLIDHRNPNALATCFHHQFTEPLCAIWESAGLRKLEHFHAEGNKSPRYFLEINPTEIIPMDEIFMEQLRNVNE